MAGNKRDDEREGREAHFRSAISDKSARKIRARAEAERSIWFWLGMMGLVGWSVAVPTLLGVFIGAWLDRVYPAEVSWTLTLLLLGLGIGCVQAWYWVKKESGDE